MSIFRDLMWFFKLERKSYLTGIFLLLVVALLNLLPPYIVGIIIDGIKNGELSFIKLLQWVLLILAIGILLYILRYFWRIMIFGASSRLGKLLRNRLFELFTKQSPSFYNQRRIGDLMAHSTNDIQAVESTAGEGVLTLIDSITMGSIVIITMASTISWKLTLIALLPMPVMAWLTNYYGTLIHDRFFKAQEAFSNLNDKVQENISGVRVIKAFGQEEAEKEEFRKQSIDTVKKNIAVAKVDSLFDPTITLIVGISFFLAIAFGSMYVIKEELTIGQLTTFTMYLGHLIWPMLAFGWLFNIVERGRASYDRIEALLNTSPDIIDRKDAIEEKPRGDILFDINSFNYPEKSNPTLNNIHFTLKRGQTLGIVGKTGSGKTTLLRLLLREFDLQDGDIKIGDYSIYDYKLYSLRSGIGYVPQDHFLFSATVAENIAFAKPNATLDEIISSAKVAAIHDDIMQFQDRYQTKVGERGVTLSGGQKQRISIARALLMEPEILILDDALSAVDAKTEEKILKALQHNRIGKTTIIATHRISAIQDADLIIVLDNGEIIEYGNHTELLALAGWYKDMYNRQQLESLVEQGGIFNE
ncbi:multidrug ABC transporter permease/ATP-binding protein [Vulcanibacillus modesticaldus]|uniref:Multidrug ABC transporter permease/ATP-binding protein n=1 Tax=Vulcanibacillus modesticaldus TaxID=337097 RepID=A0A1D2YUI3_9BACI|nr:ABC transporter transmembrane domain-containing protein [Vulcanibacillus modesticaldus]OEF99333.1 multidrug ABC transporter permease/ATP-binding protein [Vulcanibacillus modesticaldus]